MKKLGAVFAICAFLGSTAARPADVANMTGVWKLNVKKSKFDKEAAPLNVELKIEHNDPSLKYWGSVQRNQESSPDTFEFQGAIDDKTYPVKESANTGRTIKFARKSPRTVESWSSDATMEERAEMTVPRNGKTLVRRMHVKQKDGKTREWTEVYDKQP
jgi:hypothetical protein